MPQLKYCSLALRRIDRQRTGLLHICDTAPKLTKLQPMDELFRIALEQVRPLLGGGDGLVATENSGLFVFDRAPEGVVIRAGTGRFSGLATLSQLDMVAAGRSTGSCSPSCRRCRKGSSC